MPNRNSYVDPTDSSATIMRGVAAALRDEWMLPQSWPSILESLTGPANHLPTSARLRLVSLFVRNLGVAPKWAEQVTTAGLAQWAVSLYEPASRQDDAPTETGIVNTVGTDDGRLYDAIVVGAPSGGIGHLSALLGVPFLSGSFVTRYRYRGHPDNVVSYQAFGAGLANIILANNPDLAITNHYDPIHDRFLVPYVNYIRMKLLMLPAPYADFIRRRLRPGGTLLFADCCYGWGQYRVAKRHSFQVGGLGGIPDSDWIQGSPEVSLFLADHRRSGQKAWPLPFPWLRQRESEWGSLQPFRHAVEAFAAENGYRFLALNGARPEDFSRIAYYASYQAALDKGREPAGVLVDCFTQTSPTAALRAGLLPLWLSFNCTDSMSFLKRMVPDFPHGKPMLLALAPNYSPSWDVVSAPDWGAALGPNAAVTWIGVNPAAYPADVAGLFRFVPDLQAWCASHDRCERPVFSIAGLEALVKRIAALVSLT